MQSVKIIVVIPFIAVLVATNLLSGRLKRLRRAARTQAGRVTDHIGEMFGAVQAIKVAAAEEHVINRFAAINDDRRRAAQRDGLATALLQTITENMGMVGAGLVLVLGTALFQSRAFTIGDFAIFVAYLTRLSSQMGFVGMTLARQKQVGVSLERLEKLMHGAPPGKFVERGEPITLQGALPELPVIDRTDTDRLQSLDVTGLTFHYSDAVSASTVSDAVPDAINDAGHAAVVPAVADTFLGGRGIHAIDLGLRRGSFTVITGRIGSGKTTLIRALLGLVERQAGTIRWNGVAVTDPAVFMTPPRVAYTPQTPRLVSESLRANILLGQPEASVDLTGALGLAMLTPDVAAMDAGLETPVGPRGVRLSGGQIQRAAAARMFVCEPELLVFDDLSSALDVETEQSLWDGIFARRTATCLVVSHRRVVLQRADQILVMQQGAVIARGTAQELLATNEEFRAIWEGPEQRVTAP